MSVSLVYMRVETDAINKWSFIKIILICVSMYQLKYNFNPD
jgi:hypothetical protein